MTMHLPALLLTSLFILPAAIADEPQTPLGKSMENLNDALKAIRRADTPQQAASLTRDAQKALLASFGHSPALLASMPDGPAKQQAEAQYRRMLSEALTILCRMEEAFLAGKTAEAETLRESVHELKLNAHERFMEEE